ncbi:MAG: hypothetical protein MI747_14755 [Desulfobacterales bacterium]|nr:hypothetical protein [Desulfobacterales bacterium]
MKQIAHGKRPSSPTPTQFIKKKPAADAAVFATATMALPFVKPEIPQEKIACTHSLTDIAPLSHPMGISSTLVWKWNPATFS